MIKLKITIVFFKNWPSTPSLCGFSHSVIKWEKSGVLGKYMEPQWTQLNLKYFLIHLGAKKLLLLLHIHQCSQVTGCRSTFSKCSINLVQTFPFNLMFWHRGKKQTTALCLGKIYLPENPSTRFSLSQMNYTCMLSN